MKSFKLFKHFIFFPSQRRTLNLFLSPLNHVSSNKEHRCHTRLNFLSTQKNDVIQNSPNIYQLYDAAPRGTLLPSNFGCHSLGTQKAPFQTSISTM